MKQCGLSQQRGNANRKYARGRHADRETARWRSRTDSRRIGGFIREELGKLIEHYPDCGITSFKELMTKPYAKELLHYWSRGVPLYKAYGIVNAEEIYQQRTNAERQRALNSMRSKSHLRSIGGSPRAERAVPVEVMQQYREFFPDWSDGQIIKDYQSRY